MKKFKIYVTRKIPEAGLKLISKECGAFEINPFNRPLTKSEILRNVKGSDGILCLLTDKIDQDVMESAGPNLKIIANYAVGFDNIDVHEAIKRKIMVTNTPDILTQATAELAWALLISTARMIPEADRFTRQKRFKGWDPLLFLGNGISGKTLGVVGTGRIGTAFALMSKGFKMNVLYNSRSRNEVLEKELNAKKSSLKELLQYSDFVSLHLSLTPETRHLIGKHEFELMKPDSILINTARGKVIDEEALVGALKAKRIKAAGLDVYEEEPKIYPELLKLPNVVLLPHIGSATQDTREKMSLCAAQNLIAGLQGQRPKNLVNPEIFL